MKKLLFILSAIFLPFCCFAEDDEYCQNDVCVFECGTKCTATLNRQTGFFKVEGSGDMTDVEYLKTPWYPYMLDIKSVEISKDITSIGACFLCNANNVKEINIPSNVTKIGRWAFMGTELSEVSIPDSVTSIGSYAFSTYTLKHIELPKNLEYLGASFCQGCGLETLIIPESVTQMMLGENYTPFTTEKLKHVYCTETNKDLCAKALEMAGKSQDLLSLYDKKGDRYVKDGVWYRSFEDMTLDIPVKRIYTIDEANRVAGTKNRVSITYR